LFEGAAGNERSTFASRGSLHGREIRDEEDDDEDGGMEDRFMRASPISS